MRIGSFGEPGRERPCVFREDRILDLREVRPSWPRSWRRILEEGLWDEVPAAAREAPERSATGVRLGPPIVDPSKIVALGLNYRDHALEQKKEPPAAPLLFAKAPSCLVGPHDPIRLPDPAQEDQVDAEAELCVVIGRGGRAIPEARALEHVLGFTIMNDVSGRRAQYGDKQWFRGKSFDTFGPCGPWIVTRDELPDPTGLALEADWGERPMQRGNTADLIFPVPFVVSYVSRMMTLQPGDLITTGTPAGVGVFREPPVFLQRGETVTVRLARVGELRNPVI
jgi:2-keto-4-pentenoate hydratase/2-oxohepta-3-ene-1,7-dioic acid hydratase in catechol pathway